MTNTMPQPFALALLGITAVVSAVALARVVAWSHSTQRRRRLAAKEHAKTMARHRANRRTA